jgi:23S rRNA pseudouridine955/2504/2580 synthase
MDFHVSAAEAGQKIIKYLLKNSDGTKVFLFKLFRKGLITVNGLKADQAQVLREGDVVSSPQLTRPAPRRKFLSVSRKISVIFENENLIVVDKDNATVVHAGESDYRGSLLEMVKAYLYRKNESYDSVVPVHRIDRNTKGVVIFAKNGAFGKKLHALFKYGLVDKTYQAILIGSLKKTLFIEADVIVAGESRPVTVKNLKCSETVPDKKAWLENTYRNSTTLSATILKPLRRDDTKGHTWAEVTIWTGRHHQIRAIAAAAGFPVAGDKKYLGRTRNLASNLRGQELICKRIAIEELGLTFESKYSLF